MLHPTPDMNTLTDLFFNCSVAIFVTDDSGTVLLENNAARALTGSEGEGLCLPDIVHLTDGWSGVMPALTRTALLENVSGAVRCEGELEDFAVSANVSFAWGGDNIGYLFWMVRPELTHTLPAEGAAVPSAMTDAGKWISSVNAQDSSRESRLAGSELYEILKLFFHHAPAGIHLLADDGSVAYANRYDIDLVGHDGDPQTFIGHHVRQVYQDHRVVEDFMGRWGEDAPIINFRANFVRADRGVQPVLIYSTANAENGDLQNTRCIVFRDDHPDLPRSSVSAFDFQF